MKRKGGGGKRENAKMQRMETKDYSAKETKGEQHAVDQRWAASGVDLFPLSPTPAHCEGLTRAKDCGVSGGLAICCRQNDDTSPPPALCVLCCAVLCKVTPYLTCTAARGVTCANGFRPVPAHSCATDGCGVSTRAFCRNERSASLRNQSRDSLHVDTSAPPPSHTTPPHQHPPLEPHPTLRRPLAYAGCNPEFARPRTPFAFCFDDRSV